MTQETSMSILREMMQVRLSQVKKGQSGRTGHWSGGLISDNRGCHDRCTTPSQIKSLVMWQGQDESQVFGPEQSAGPCL